MKRKTQTHFEVLEKIRELVERGYSPKRIQEHLEVFCPEHGYRMPSKSTIDRHVRELTPPDPSGDWSLADADPEDARIVLDVVAYIIEQSEGRVWPSRELANWIVRIAKAAPTLEPWEVYSFANRYRVHAQRELSTRMMDTILAFKPWESESAAQRYRAALIADKSIPLLKVATVLQD